MKSLIIAEKPSVGRDIARVLHCTKKSNNYIEGNKYIVTWALGHLVTLKDPEEYNKRFKEWKMEDLPLMPKELGIKVIPQTGRQYHAVESLLKRNDIGEIIIATDAGREGELVARWILKKANNNKPLKRLWISSVTDKAILDGMNHLRPGKEYENLYHAAVSRAEADWLVGINCTRALTCKYNAQLSCGRVQTPTLGMIDKRDREIKAFVPKTYFTLRVRAENITFSWRENKGGSGRIFAEDKAKAMVDKLEQGVLKVERVDKKEKKVYAPMLYDLTELQRDANKRFGYSAKQTLNTMQALYERHKVLTYPRTDSRYLTADIVPTIKERLDAIMIGPYRTMAGKAKQIKLTGRLSFVNDSKVSDHHAIIPTEQVVLLNNMSKEERNVYDLVVRRFLSVLFPPYIYEETTIYARCKEEMFVARGKRTIAEGYREIDSLGAADTDADDEDEATLKEQQLPIVQQGQSFSGIQPILKEGKTKPPSKFTEATLLSAMENPVHFMESENQTMAKTLGETGGLGTVATRADIIEKLFNSFLIEKNGNDITITGKGKQLLNLVPEDLKKPELTAGWEMKLSDIAKGKLKSITFMQEIRKYAVNLVNKVKVEEGTFRHDNLTNKKCPTCGKRMLSVNGKNAKMLICEDRACGYRETLSRTTNARCPVCHKRMEMIGQGEQSTFVCACGHKERLTKFEERRKKEGAGVSKRDVASYMAKQKKEANEPVNNAFANALSGIKLDQ